MQLVYIDPSTREGVYIYMQLIALLAFMFLGLQAHATTGLDCVSEDASVEVWAEVSVDENAQVIRLGLLASFLDEGETLIFSETASEDRIIDTYHGPPETRVRKFIAALKFEEGGVLAEVLLTDPQTIGGVLFFTAVIQYQGEEKFVGPVSCVDAQGR